MKKPRKIHAMMKRRKKRYLTVVKRYLKYRYRTRLTILVCAVTLTVVGFIFVMNSRYPSESKLVTFHDRGNDHVILTKASTIREALKDANITIDAKDVVEPSIDEKLLTSDSAVIIYRARPVLVIDGSFRERILTPAQSPNEIALAVGTDPVSDKDKTTITNGDFVADGASTKLVIERAVPEVVKPVFGPTPQALTASKGAQIFVDGSGVAHRETYYDLPMNIVIRHCSDKDYSIRYDGAKIDSDGYVLVAANYAIYPKCSIVETSLGPGKVYDTGGFALRYPHGFDLATDWTNRNGR